MLRVVSICHHTKISQHYWLYSLCCPVIPEYYSSFQKETLPFTLMWRMWCCDIARHRRADTSWSMGKPTIVNLVKADSRRVVTRDQEVEEMRDGQSIWTSSFKMNMFWGLTYSTVTVVNNALCVLQFDQESRCQVSHHTHKNGELCKVSDVFIGLIMMLVRKCARPPNHHMEHLHFMQFAFVDCISGKLGKWKTGQRRNEAKGLVPASCRRMWEIEHLVCQAVHSEPALHVFIDKF